jgi:hypothetical protein
MFKKTLALGVLASLALTSAAQAVSVEIKNDSKDQLSIGFNPDKSSKLIFIAQGATGNKVMTFAETGGNPYFKVIGGKFGSQNVASCMNLDVRKKEIKIQFKLKTGTTSDLECVVISAN